LGRELEDVIREFSDLAAKKQAPLRVIPEDEWSKSQSQQQAGGDPPRQQGRKRYSWDRYRE
jgi:hypothetical protein